MRRSKLDRLPILTAPRRQFGWRRSCAVRPSPAEHPARKEAHSPVRSFFHPILNVRRYLKIARLVRVGCKLNALNTINADFATLSVEPTTRRWLLVGGVHGTTLVRNIGTVNPVLLLAEGEGVEPLTFAVTLAFKTSCRPPQQHPPIFTAGNPARHHLDNRARLQGCGPGDKLRLWVTAELTPSSRADLTLGASPTQAMPRLIGATRVFFPRRRSTYTFS